MADEVVKHGRAQWLRDKRRKAAEDFIGGLVGALKFEEAHRQAGIAISARGLVDLIETIESEVRL